MYYVRHEAINLLEGLCEITHQTTDSKTSRGWICSQVALSKHVELWAIISLKASDTLWCLTDSMLSEITLQTPYDRTYSSAVRKFTQVRQTMQHQQVKMDRNTISSQIALILRERERERFTLRKERQRFILRKKEREVYCKKESEMGISMLVFFRLSPWHVTHAPNDKSPISKSHPPIPYLGCCSMRPRGGSGGNSPMYVS